MLDGTQFNIKLTVANQGQRKDKFFDFVIAGPNGVGPAPAVATDVGVKGGTQTARYNYQASSLGTVTFDGALHATLDNHSNLYNLSNVTFCLAKVIPQATITVRSYQDKGVDGSFTAGDPYVNGWTVFIDANGNGRWMALRRLP